ncbi:hypothetical protein [Occallatibacter riparius]|uniref:Apea-like HEPN domain-containing protein n=1 Tax=Occallatibacter riparius TaxID=1002689 RepID=A0A9J7BWK3_9BACT|nr:hypothetical protein [Occallatibacter riparius]UWZ85254.1 hypothetical protein MOP44_04760 [Occallatibacter riparius]
MQLLTGRDHEPPVFVGPGQIELKSTTIAEFRLFASARENADGILKVHLAHANPYERLDQFRLFAEDFDGTEWACGWVVPRVEQDSSAGTLLVGTINSLLTKVSADWVSTTPGAELLFQPSIHIPMSASLQTVHSIADEEICRSWRLGMHALEILGSRIEFAQDPTDGLLWITASTSAELPHPYLENWLSEPLRILLGQLHYPRLVARNFGDGSAFISIRQSPKTYPNASIGSLLASELVPPTERFWQLYAALLTLIAEDRNDQGQPNFEAHRITRFYEEVIQASQGSRWVWCLTLASAAEALAKMLMRPEDQQTEFPASDLRSIKKTVSAWKGDENLRSRILSAIGLLSRRSVASFLRELANRGIIESRQAAAWNRMRNDVMHGNLVVPWSSQQEDETIIALAELVHTLTREIAGVGNGDRRLSERML